MQAAAQKLHQRTAHPPTVEPDQISEANQLFERATHHFINLLQANKYIHILTPIELEWPNIQNALEWAYVHQRWNLLANGVLPLIQNSIWGIGFMDAMGYWQEAISLIERNLEGRDELPPLTVAILLSHLGHYYRRLDQEEKTAAFLDEAEEIITTLPDTIDKLPSLIYIYEQRAHLVGQSEPDKAIPWLIKAIQLLSKTKLTERLRFQLGYTYLQLATFLAKIGQWDQGQKTVHQAFKLLPNSVNHSRIKGLLILSNIAAVQDNLHQRIQYLDEAIPIARELRDYRSLITLWGNLSISYKRLGKLEEALTIGKNVLSLCHRMGNIQHLIKVHVNQGQLYLRLGKYHNAWDHFTHAQENSNTFNSNQWFPLINLWFAQWKLAAGHLSEATQLIEEVENIGFKIDQSLMPVIHRVQAEIALANQEYGQALALLHKAFSSFDQHPSPIEEALCWRTQGLVFAAFHQYKGMNFAFQKSVDILTEKDYYEHAHTQYLWAKTLWEHQRPQPNPITLLQNVIPVFEEQKAIANLHEARLLLDKIERAQAPAH
ncbi:MAG TPA: hypothetical protein VLL52_17955, partial [Anaerolineae bacterium]|nr:hypothetical protein [Anaerolineae bacterium]